MNGAFEIISTKGTQTLISRRGGGVGKRKLRGIVESGDRGEKLGNIQKKRNRGLMTFNL